MDTSLKENDTTAVTTAINKDCIWWLHENCYFETFTNRDQLSQRFYLWKKNETFWIYLLWFLADSFKWKKKEQTSSWDFVQQPQHLNMLALNVCEIKIYVT